MISAFGLNKLAREWNGIVSGVLLNDSIKITEFQATEVEGNVYILEFNVPSEVGEITNLKTLDDEENILSNNNLFVPVEADIKFKYVVTFTSVR